MPYRPAGVAGAWRCFRRRALPPRVSAETGAIVCQPAGAELGTVAYGLTTCAVRRCWPDRTPWSRCCRRCRRCRRSIGWSCRSTRATSSASHFSSLASGWTSCRRTQRFTARIPADGVTRAAVDMQRLHTGASDPAGLARLAMCALLLMLGGRWWSVCAVQTVGGAWALGDTCVRCLGVDGVGTGCADRQVGHAGGDGGDVPRRGQRGRAAA